MEELYTQEEQIRLSENIARLTAAVQGVGAPFRDDEGRRMLSVDLERLVIDPVSGRTILFEEGAGLEVLLGIWAQILDPFERRIENGRLFGFFGELPVADGSSVRVSVSLLPGGQLRTAVGPSPSVSSLLSAVETLDEEFVAACERLDVEWQLVALGVNPVPADAREVPLVPQERFRLMDAYLSQTGRYARDMMRLSAATRISIDCGEGERLSRAYALAVALAPVVAFLCDNVSAWRGLSAEDTPRMARSRIWEHVDLARCGVVPGSMSGSFAASDYVDWLLGVRPILFTSEHGRTFSTGSATERDILAFRDLAEVELEHLLSMVYPVARLKGHLELCTADAMPPNLALALAAFVKGLFYDDAAFARAWELVAQGRDDAEVPRAYRELREHGWDAVVYDLPVTTVVSRLIQLAENGLHDEAERTIFHGLSGLWQARMVPRDLYQSQA